MRKSLFRMGWLASGFVAFLFALLLFPAQPAFACSTTRAAPDYTPIPLLPLNEKIKQAEFIFEGTITGNDFLTTAIVVRRYFKGENTVVNFQKGINSTASLNHSCIFYTPPEIQAIFYGGIYNNMLFMTDFTPLEPGESNNSVLIYQIINEVGQTPHDMTNNSPAPGLTTSASIQSSGVNTPGITQNTSSSTTAADLTNPTPIATGTTPHKIDDSEGTTGWYFLTIFGVVLVGSAFMLALRKFSRGSGKKTGPK